MDVSICIVNWNTGHLLCDCIRSISERTTGVEYEVIVVDNNSADQSIELVRKEFPDCLLISSRENLGFSRGNNCALRRASGEYVLFLNPDTILKTNAILGMFNFMEANATVGAVGCELLNQDDSIQYTCARTYPTLRNQFCYWFMLNRLFPRSRFLSGIDMAYWDHKSQRDVECLSGACIFMRRGIADELEGFDERLFMYAEDVDLCFRVRSAGWRIVYLPSEKIYHLEGQSVKNVGRRNFSAIAQRESNHYFFLKHHGKARAAAYRILVMTGSAFRLVVLLTPLARREKGAFASQRGDLISRYFSVLRWAVGAKRNLPR